MLHPTAHSVSLSLAFVAFGLAACGTEVLTEPPDAPGGSTVNASGEEDEGPASATTGTASDGSSGQDVTTDADALDTSSTGEGTTGEPSTGDGSTGDPSTGDPSAGDGETTDGGAPVACDELPGVLLCEDFEGPAIDTQTWKKLQSNGGTLQIGDERVISGGRALHLHIAAEQGSEANLELLPTTEIFPVPDNHFFGRVFALVTSDLPNKHSIWMQAEGVVGGQKARGRLDTAGGSQRFKMTYSNPEIDQHGGLQKLGRKVPIGAWVCIEWEFDGDHDEARFWFDGELDDAMTVASVDDPPWVAPVFKTFIIGHKTLQQPDSAPAYDIWMDALVLATERIGCE